MKYINYVVFGVTAVLAADALVYLLTGVPLFYEKHAGARAFVLIVLVGYSLCTRINWED